MDEDIERKRAKLEYRIYNYEVGLKYHWVGWLALILGAIILGSEFAFRESSIDTSDLNLYFGFVFIVLGLLLLVMVEHTKAIIPSVRRQLVEIEKAMDMQSQQK